MWWVVVIAGFMKLVDGHARCSQICSALSMLEQMERGREVWGGGVKGMVLDWISVTLQELSLTI